MLYERFIKMAKSKKKLPDAKPHPGQPAVAQNNRMMNKSNPMQYAAGIPSGEVLNVVNDTNKLSKLSVDVMTALDNLCKHEELMTTIRDILKTAQAPIDITQQLHSLPASNPAAHREQIQQFVGQKVDALKKQTQPQAVPTGSSVPTPSAASIPAPVTKVADAPALLARKEYFSISPEGKVLVKRLDDDRFEFPSEGEGKPAQYEQSVIFAPKEGVQEVGYHGYEVHPFVGAPRKDEGYEELPVEDVLQKLYGSMGLAKNRPYMNWNRVRARILFRLLKAHRATSNAPV